MQEEREIREAARAALAQLSEWLERAGAGGRAGAARNRILEGPTLDALARLRPGSAAALADLRDVPRFSKNKRKQYGDAIVAALAQARAAALPGRHHAWERSMAASCHMPFDQLTDLFLHSVIAQCQVHAE